MTLSSVLSSSVFLWKEAQSRNKKSERTCKVLDIVSIEKNKKQNTLEELFHFVVMQLFYL